MNFVALDFETANECRDSACAVGLTTVSDGKIAASTYHLLRPPELRFSPWNTKIHGLGVADVVDSPTFGELWPSIRHLVEGNLIIAHNASFDTSVLRHSLSAAGIEVPRTSYLCSLSIARRAWPDLATHSLGFLASTFGLELDHHNAASDATASATLVLRAATELGHNCPFKLAEALGIYVGEIFSHDQWMSCSSPRTPRDSQTLEVVLPDGYDISQHPFYRKNIEFTGRLDLFGRSDAERVVSLFGGNSNNSVSKKTHYLVIGVLDVRTLAAGQTESGKIQKVRALKEKGFEIRIISEADFAELIFSPVVTNSDVK
jgi:DNA polymerase-3 subunit epsilon